MRSRTLGLAVLLMVALVASACTPSGGAQAPSAYGPGASAATAVPVTGATAAPAATSTSAPANAGGGAYGGGGYGDQGTAATATSAPAAGSAGNAAGAAQVALGKNASLGSYLVDDKGMTLYVFLKDTGGTSVCYGSCAATWPALLTSGAPMGGAGVDASKLGTTTRTDGSVQVTYNGMPLYHYAPDGQPGDVKGEGVGGVWFVVGADGQPIK